MPSAARQADPHALYERAVQQPELLIGFVESVFEDAFGTSPQVLREDFCGTAHTAATWVVRDAGRRATGVGLDEQVLAWAERHNRKPLGKAGKRLRLTRADVCRSRAAADVTLSLNFSHFTYKSRDELVRYFRHAHRCLRTPGLFVCDLYGGPLALQPCCDGREFEEFTYLWEQQRYDPATAEALNHIHFRFPDGSALERAFTYDWRLWTLAELREALHEVGFIDTIVYYEDEDGFDPDLDAAELEAYVAYVVAVKA